MKPSLKAARYLTDHRGRKIGVILPIREFKELLAKLEELESIREYDAALASRDEAIPFRQATRDLERFRKCVKWFSFCSPFSL
jgi:hypothetical protein